jgi:PKD repeat protein
LQVSFDASASSDPDNDAIASYVFNYGDGTTETKTVPTASHTYRDNGVYSATVTVSDSRGLASTNSANAVIQVATTLQSVVSRKNHNGVALDLNLPLGGTPAIESRTGGANGDHTIIFTFARNLTQVGTATATSTSGSPTVTSRGIGPAPNQYTVNISGVQNARRVTVRLDNVQDTDGANLTDVRAQMNVLFGDTNGDGVVNSGDALQTRGRAGQQADANNFRSDVNVDGTVNGGDTIIVRNQSGTALQSGDSDESRN